LRQVAEIFVHGDCSDSGENDDSNRDGGGDVIEERVLWVVDGGK